MDERGNGSKGGGRIWCELVAGGERGSSEERESRARPGSCNRRQRRRAFGSWLSFLAILFLQSSIQAPVSLKYIAAFFSTGL